MNNERFIETFQQLKMQEKDTKVRFSLSWSEIYPILGEDTQTTAFDSHYIYHTAWAARMLQDINPKIHIDISSSLYFSSIVSAFIPIQFYDYRPTVLNLSKLTTGCADLINLPFEDNSIESLSCMHVIEHIGLGRYGDTVDYDGDLKAISELKRVLMVDGHLLFVIPMGESKIFFNAHRVYSFNIINEMFPNFSLKQFAFLPDDAQAGMIINPSSELVTSQKYACGCFLLQKLF